ncbi:MAG: hypothetical protein EOM52_08165, partial [Clostridia bacterium]|nr:hypothetical protein [Clostridia bacterium]
MKKQLKVLSALVCVLALAGTAAASSVITTRTLQAQYMGIQIKVDGQTVTPKDATGNTVEPFIVDGTTYLPVRALGEAIGKQVTWDGETKTVSVESPLYQDARTLVETIESTHPAFVLNDVPEGYAAAKETFLKTAAQPGLSAVQFAWASMAYTSAMRDGHTQMWGMVGGMPEIRILWAADGSHLYLLDRDGKVTKREVVQIGGVEVKDVFNLVDTYFAAENASYSNRNHGDLSKLNGVLQMAGAKVEEGKIVLTVMESGKKTTLTAEIAEPMGGAREAVIDHKMVGDVFYVDFNACVPGDEVDATAAALKKAVESGTSKVIIDVRGNGGGDSRTCDQLLAAMDMAAPGYGGYLRISPLAKATYPDDLGTVTEDLSAAPDPAAARQNPAVKLVVLTDEYTFSSATMMGVFIQDGKLGTLVGRPSSNAPSSYGDVLSFELPNTKFKGGVSYKQFRRPDVNADQKTLVPEVQTALGQDILQTALDYLK